MILTNYRVSLSPGNELRNYFGSKETKMNGSRNYIGIESPAVDAMIDHIVSAQKREDLVTAVRALDRILTHNYYVIPNWYSPVNRLAYWNKFEQPKTTPKHGLGFNTWWIKEEFRK